jgi:hypothetical protein
LFDWLYSMHSQQENVRQWVDESRQRYPSLCNRRSNPLVLVVSHSRRMLVNSRQNALLKPEGAPFLEWSGDDPVGCTMLPQSMYVWLGLELIASPRGSGKSPVTQGVL